MYIAILKSFNDIYTIISLVFAGYSSYDYYIDGSNAHSKPTWDSWITSNNETIPINSTFWSPGTPDVIDSDHCVRMDWKKGHKFNNIPFAYQYFYICEK